MEEVLYTYSNYHAANKKRDLSETAKEILVERKQNMLNFQMTLLKCIIFLFFFLEKLKLKIHKILGSTNVDMLSKSLHSH